MTRTRVGEFEELIMLAIRALDDAASCRAVQTMLEERAERAASLGSIYATIDRLERKGYVESWVDTPAEGIARRGRFHRVTTDGVDALDGMDRIRDSLREGAFSTGAPRGE